MKMVSIEVSNISFFAEYGRHAVRVFVVFEDGEFRQNVEFNLRIEGSKDDTVSRIEAFAKAKAKALATQFAEQS